MIGVGTTIFLVRPQTFGGTPFTNEKSLLFDGVDEYVTIPDDATLDISDNLSVTAWVKTTTTSLGGIVTKWGGSVARSWSLQLQTNGRLFGRISSIGGTADNKEYYTTSATVNDGNWHFVCMTFATGTLKLYIDGTEITAVTKSKDGTCNSIFNSATAANIGARNNGTEPLSGNVDEAAVWDTTVLSASDITDLYNSGAPTDLSTYAGSANLVSWWRCGDGDTYSTITDNVGSNNGTMTNMEAGDIVTDTP